MPTKKECCNLRLSKSHSIQHKLSYNGLSDIEKKYIKTLKRQQSIENELDRFYRDVKRLPNGIVDWESLDGCTLNWFTYTNKLNERLVKQLSKFDDLIDTDATYNYFRQINTKSESF